VTPFVVVRTAQAVLTVVLASMVVFLGVHALPGDPALSVAGQEGARDPELLEAIRAEYGLDQPLPVQYLAWAGHVVRGDFGQSVRTGLPVSEMVLQRIPITLELGVLSIMLAVVIGVSTGVVAAVNRGRTADYASSFFALGAMSIPNFWLGLLLISTVSIRWGLLPSSGYVPFTEDPVANLEHMVLPAIVLGTGISAIIARQTRSSMLQTMEEDFVRTARAKGVPERKVVRRHVLRNSLLTVVTIVGLQLGVLIGGSVVTEQVFLIPGFGKLIVDAVITRDYPVIQAVALLSAVAYVVLNLLVDVLYSTLNPRIRLAGAAS
jgi:peptide/nickel transport system permease protein